MTQALLNDSSSISDIFTQKKSSSNLDKNDFDFDRIIETKMVNNQEKSVSQDDSIAKIPKNSIAQKNGEENLESLTEESTLIIDSEDVSEDSVSKVLQLEAMLTVVNIENSAISELSLDEIEDEENMTVSEDENDDKENMELSEEDAQYTTTITNEDSTMNTGTIKLEPLKNPSQAICFEQSQNVNDGNNQQNYQLGELSISKSNDVSVDNAVKFDLNTENAGNELNIEQKNSLQTTEEKNSLEELLDNEMLEELNIKVLSSNSADDSSSGDLIQYQSPQEQGVKAVIQSEVKYEDIKLNVQSPTKVVSEDITPSKILEQITKQLEGLNGNMSKLNIVLNPGSLGKVMINLVNSKDGLSAQFAVSSQETKNILMNGVNELRECLLAQGINVDNVTVKVSDTAKASDNKDWTEQNGSRGGNKQQQKGHQKNSEKQFEQMMFEINNNGKV